MNTRERTVSAAPANGQRRGGRRFLLATTAAVGALAAGCAGTGHLSAGPARAPASLSASAAPGMRMPASEQTAGPSASALMVCSPEIRKDVTSILAPLKVPTTTTSWTDHLYTCTYQLPTGRLVLSVKESPDPASATAYFDTLRTHLGRTTALTAAQALGNPGYESADGTVVVLKDGKTLRVDATGMPTASGPHQLSRGDLAYEIASDVLGCWNE
ncbi:hypothetical protein [Streptacidiphilus jiangxiensis]|uniref:DUF3558 domain-containing protein n=1 Tax=Streptacidiphilus jiangxiensis TaxID=235985 RepID=A0A1H7H654_STRJI|nr:hypothetical protein [Streptacidiphilus jiangxiensis]SEK45247.1 hypothetical protein SAMN05414137_10276 [Streptacidiphilus jiangxiensis]